ncbi:hypothetical protein J0H58_09540 [bacterium]|nr:hypothetical protein [bacterium]
MDDEPVGPLPPEVEARMARRLAVLLGDVPLVEMTQEEVIWVFEQKVRTPEVVRADDRHA